jgi:hypothetical protein
MEAKEIRIGNLFRFGVNVITIQSIHQVTIKNAVDGKRPWHVYVSGFIDADPHYCIDGYKIEPIPITKEWLLSFGFKDTIAEHTKQIDLVDFGLQKLGVTISEEKNIISIGDYYSGKEEIVILTTSPFLFVHQLQNLFFSIKGTELVLAVAGSEIKKVPSGGNSV